MEWNTAHRIASQEPIIFTFKSVQTIKYHPAGKKLTVRFLVPRTSARTTELLGLHTAWVGNQQGPVVGHEDALELVLGSLVNKLLVVGNQALGDSLANGVKLRYVTTTVNADANVQVSVFVKANGKEWLVDLETENLWLNKGNGDTVQLDKTLTFLNICDSSGSLLLAESLHARNGLLLLTHSCVCTKILPMRSGNELCEFDGMTNETTRP